MFIISEISPQFGNDLELAEQMIFQSKLAGAHAAKIQLYPTTMFFDNPNDYLVSRELSFDDFKRLKEFGDNLNIPVFATAFTEELLEWCTELKQKYYKVAARMHKESPELVEKIMVCDGRIFISVPAGYDESEFIVKDNYSYLSCVSKYPTLLEDVVIPDFKNSIFSGISDHSVGISAALYAAARGASLLEKHFTVSTALQRSNETAHYGSMDRFELEQIATLSREMELIALNNNS